MTLQIRLFGHLRIQSDGRGLALSPRAQRLLMYLLLHRADRLPRRSLAFNLWPDMPEDDALGTLRRALNDLRAGLEEYAACLTASRGEVFWDCSSNYQLDIELFESSLQSADAESLERAVELYTGDLLKELDEDWVTSTRERYRQLQLDALRKLTLHHQSLHNFAQALEYTRRALLLDPYSESTYQDRIRLFFLSGDRPAALAEYDRLQTVLENELGVAPMDETRALAEAIVRGEFDPADSHLATVTAAFQIPPRLVGRDEELSELINSWEIASLGHGKLAIVSGEAGVGKSHLVRSLAYEVSQRGGLVLTGYCYEFENSLPHQPIVEALRSVVSIIQALPLSSAHRAALARLLPDIYKIEETAKPSFSPDELRLQLFEALLQTFVFLAQRQPILLLFEDMHWASESVLDWATFIAPRLRENRMMVTITYRTDEVDLGHALPRLTRRFEREEVVTSIPLDRLSRTANREWVAHLSGLEGSSAIGVADRLYTETAGNPFFLQEIVREMLETGQIQLEQGKWSGAFIQKGKEAEVLLPESLRETILARTSRLSEMARSFLQAAATAGRTFLYEIVARAGGWADEASLHALEELCTRGFVYEANPSGTFMFTHHLLREAVYADLTTPRRVYWHLHLAKTIQTLHPDDYASLAYHFASAGEREMGIAYSKMAAERAEALYAYEDASQHLRSALNLLGVQEHSASRLELLEALGDDYRYLRQGIEAISNYEAALQLWHELGKPDKMTFIRLHRKLRQTSSSMWESTELTQNKFAARKSNEMTESRGSLLRAIEELEPHEETVRLLRELTVDSLIYHFPEEKEQALDYARQAVKLAEHLNEPVALSAALMTVVNVYGSIGLLRERIDVVKRALGVCDDPRFDNSHLRIQILLTTAKSLIDVGEYHEALDYLDQTESLARPIHAVHEVHQALGLMHQCWFRLDRWDKMWETEAKRRVLQEKYPLSRIGAPCFAIGLSSAVHQLQGNFEKARELRDESYEIMVGVTGTAENWKRSQRY